MGIRRAMTWPNAAPVGTAAVGPGGAAPSPGAPTAGIRVLMIFGLCAASPGAAASAPFACAGFAQLGGAQLLCSHTAPAAPPQICTFSWTLSGPGSAPTVVQGGFLLTPGITNVTVYQGSGFAHALANPVVLCQARRGRT